MTDSEQYPFALDAHPAKADPALIDDDVQHFTRIATCLTAQITDLEQRLDAHRRAPGGGGQAALDRDLEIHRLTARLALLRRFGLDLCLGRIVTEHEVRYVGRIGLRDSRGDALLVDWRTPAAEPFFGATLANPMGVSTRRRYRWTGRRITDYWDEAFSATALASGGALDDQSAFIASLGASRSPRMRDVLGTIQADQDAIIRAGADGVLVVDGGPGTGKTVVALHRAAYLLYADPRLRSGHGGVLFVGPSHAYTSYVADILPGLGEEGVRTCTLADLLPEGREVVPEADPRVARIKSDRRMTDAVEAAIGLRERPPARATSINTAWGELPITVQDWAEAIAAADPASTHNAAREDIWTALLEILRDRAAPHTDDRADDAGPASRAGRPGLGRRQRRLGRQPGLGQRRFPGRAGLGRQRRRRPQLGRAPLERRARLRPSERVRRRGPVRRLRPGRAGPSHRRRAPCAGREHPAPGSVRRGLAAARSRHPRARAPRLSGPAAPVRPLAHPGRDRGAAAHGDAAVDRGRPAAAGRCPPAHR
ncbi:hypothetical protein [Salana multivorans]